MQTFELVMIDSTKELRFNNVTLFHGSDRSGQFGIMARHQTFMTSLLLSLCWFFTIDDPLPTYVALSGGILYFNRNILSIVTPHFFVDKDMQKISINLEQELKMEEQQRKEMRERAKNLEKEMLKRMWEMQKEAPK
ncbi:ATP synthase F0F1 subunit epsilon [Methylacidiphilum kamchatkense Kam1]|uniref:ATP synthase F0F1 subunit epsilon n=1 Tax=Methylacidiphilum kamchatkense Kam1 TaxID=1202785 RepID=A0A0C1V378_9BACT|nr:ATP synthase F0F1 subunit epsilon [Methylacidiphilum kamchatkense]KIE58155.1 ATP synthase F0F1 subunit epsilon [Methylacidiphilum kamchatkense Kam1]QDQ42152.1 F-type H+-transporting ATPase subunit epsilon [Methylacidiphilum kamchatkense Kam1]